MTSITTPQVRVYGKNLRYPKKGKSYWTDISEWKMSRFRETGRFPKSVNVTTKAPRNDSWSRNLSPIRMGPVDTYVENGSPLLAVSVEVAWQYSKIYSHRNEDGRLVPLDFTDSQGRPNRKWFQWRDESWNNSSFDWRHPDFERNKKLVRRGFPKGSVVQSWYWNGKLLGPVEARREIYSTLYSREVRKTSEFRQLQTLYKSGGSRDFRLRWLRSCGTRNDGGGHDPGPEPLVGTWSRVVLSSPGDRSDPDRGVITNVARASRLTSLGVGGRDAHSP